MRLSWWTIAGITGLSLLILRTGNPIPVLLVICAGLIVAALLGDRYEKRMTQKERDSRIDWQNQLSFEVQRVNDEGYDALCARVTNQGEDDIRLPPISAWLSFTCYPGGSPGRGGNGLGAIGLKDDISRGERLAPGASLLLPVDTHAQPVRPQPLPLPKRLAQKELPQRQKEMLKLGQSRMHALADEVTSHPSLAAFLEAKGGDTFMVEFRVHGQNSGWMISGAAAWGG